MLLVRSGPPCGVHPTSLFWYPLASLSLILILSELFFFRFSESWTGVDLTILTKKAVLSKLVVRWNFGLYAWKSSKFAQKSLSYPKVPLERSKRLSSSQWRGLHMFRVLKIEITLFQSLRFQFSALYDVSEVPRRWWKNQYRIENFVLFDWFWPYEPK